MGIGLSHPVSSKVLIRKGNKYFKVGGATMHGWRETMEDAHSVILNLPNHPTTAFFGIFDGHSGSACSKFISNTLPNHIDALTDEELTNPEKLAETVMDTDEQFLQAEEFKNKDDGSAGIFTIAICDPSTNTYKLVNANIGDSRTVLSKRKDDTYTAIACTYDHKPTNEAERKRIEAAGGSVQLARVDGQLALSRAFGDRMLKHPLTFPPQDRKVTSKPDIIEETASTDDFLFLACDGIYEGDVFTRDSVIRLIAEKLKETEDLAMICASVLDECLRRGSRDNMSAFIVKFVDGTSYHSEKTEYLPGQWYADDGDTKFQEAYIKDAKDAGYSLADALKLLDEQKKAQQIPTSSSPPEH
eukprot:TRINITY_DN552_c0_g1_i2.p1 TRINITY_DN552_c0_g1~~TRINITY_DN552_c0_g1_i2.p1  ORF type:complete len:358 (-),score=76.47 TRINITY_DN552_c0_g1_i2:181-1254(-)